MKNISLLLSFILGIARMSSCAQHLKSPPNIILILSDDQDIELHGLHPLQQTMQLFKMHGTQFTRAFTSTPICCPSRASLLSGQYAHNHKTYNNSLNGGCNGQLWREQFEPRSFPVLLQNRNYETFFAGKYLNQYKGTVVPPGWNKFHGLHGNSRYYNYTLLENVKNVSYTDTYLTDLLIERTAEFIQNACRKQPTGKQPFFAMIAPPAAHEPFTPAPRHAGSFADVSALRTPSFNLPDSTKHWLVGSSQHLSEATISSIDVYFQKRWETLLSVDEMVTTLVAVLNETQCLATTYIIYTSDNGYHLGQFAQPLDKRQPYETDIKVPLLIMGPDVPISQLIHTPVSLLDLAPTILEWAGISVPDYMDGTSFKKELDSAHKNMTQKMNHERTLLIEYWGEGNDGTFNPLCPGQRNDHLAQCSPDVECHCQDAWNNTYVCIRDFRFNLDRIYCQFHDTEHFEEAYDLTEDPYQLRNIVNDLVPIEKVTYSILLKKLIKCAGKECHE